MISSISDQVLTWVTETDIPPLIQLKRLIRHYFLVLIGMFSAVYQLLWHMRAYDEYEFPYPLPTLFLWFYNIIRCAYPATRRDCEAPDLDILNSPAGESFEIDLPEVVPDDVDMEVSSEKSQFARLFSGPTQSQLWCATIFGYAMFLWLVTAEVVACVKT